MQWIWQLARVGCAAELSLHRTHRSHRRLNETAPPVHLDIRRLARKICLRVRTLRQTGLTTLILILFTSGADRASEANPLPCLNAQGWLNASTEYQETTVRVRLFVNDDEQPVAPRARLEIRSGNEPVRVNRRREDHFEIDPVHDAWAFVFTQGDLIAAFNALPPHILKNGGELLIAFITKPDRLLRDVRLIEGSRGSIEKYFGYDDLRARIAEQWRKAEDSERRVARRAIFFSFTPEVNGDPVVISGHYFAR